MKTIEIGGETLVTPNELDKAGVISLAKQWQLRRAGVLKHYRNGVKVFYSWKNHIEPYLALTEQAHQPGSDENTEGK